jgi:dihydroorotase
MTDVRIRGGLVHLPSGEVRADVLIEDGKIAGLVDPDSRGPEARSVIDAAGLEVMPGVVDLHAHSRTPGYEHKEDFKTLSAAAAVGGITTFVDMPNVDPPTVSADLLLEKRAIAQRDSLIDWGHFGSASRADAVQAMADAGATGFKIFMVGGGYPHDDRIAVSSNRELYLSLEAVAKTGLPCLVHPFDQALFDLFWQRALADGRKPDHRTRVEVYTGIDLVWRSAVATLIEFQRETGVRLHLLHTHAEGSIRLIRAAKAAGQQITAAIDPKYFHLTRADMERLGPRSYSGAVVTERPQQLAAIWQALKDGTIDLIDSDHGPHTLEEVDRAREDASKAELGSPQYDDMLSVLLNDVNRGLLSMRQLVQLLCENPARLIGWYPQKGSLLPGSDADVVLVDMSAEIELRDERVKTKVGWTPYHGWKVRGTPVLTLSGGHVIARDGQVHERPDRPKYLGGRPTGVPAHDPT